MRALLIFSMLFLLNFSFAQQSIEKWNMVYNRYETFDSNGNMISYKVWNSVYQRWETYSTSNANDSGYEVNEPRTNYNFELLKQVMATKQNKYDNNKQRVSAFITNTRNLLNTSSLDGDLIQKIKDRFNREYLKPYYDKNYDLSSNSLTQSIIDWFESGFDKILSEESNKFTKVNNSSTAKLVGGYYVPIIEEQRFENNKWLTAKTETYNAFLFFDSDMLWFKRGKGDWIARKLVFIKYDFELKGYTYSSDFGNTFLNDDFKYVLFYDKSNSKIRYFYMIGEKNESITINKN